MEPWVWITFGAATAQTLRFMLQKHLAATSLSAAGATFARFVYAAPLAALGLLAYSRGGADLAGPPGPEFWGYALMGGVSQILATICVVALFKHRNFAVGITFKKTEVLLSVLVGFLILGDRVTLPALAAIILGIVGVLLLSDPPGGTGPWHRRIWNRAAGLGMLSGFFFGFSGNGYRGASLSLGLDDAALSALFTLACVTAMQTILLGAWLAIREQGEITRVLRTWRISGLVGITSVIGSFCWFTAFTLQNVGYVNAVGQVELILSMIASVFFFREEITGREALGVAILTVSIVALILSV